MGLLASKMGQIVILQFQKSHSVVQPAVKSEDFQVNFLTKLTFVTIRKLEVELRDFSL